MGQEGALHDASSARRRGPDGMGRLAALWSALRPWGDATALAALAVVAAYALWPTRNASFSMQDDHEVIAILRGRPRLPLADFFPSLWTYAFEHDGRFHPFYWVVRLLEATTAGGNPHIWYLDRYLLFVVSAVIAYAIARRFVDPFCSLVFSLLVFAGRQLEVWYRLGPLEGYAVLLTLGGLFVLVRVWHKGETRPTRMTVGFLLLGLAGLTKENFTILLPEALLFSVLVVPRMVRQRVRPPWSRGDHITIWLFTALAVVELSAVATVRLVYGDFYHRSQSPFGVISSVAWFVAWSIHDGWWLLPVVLTITALGLTSKRANADGRRDGVRLFLVIGAATALFLLPQAAFYSNTVMSGRYLLPANFAAAAALLASQYFFPDLRGGLGRLGRAALIAATAAVLVLGVLPQMQSQRDLADAWTIHTNGFQYSLARIVAMEDHLHLQGVVFVTNGQQADFEPIISTSRYLAVDFLPSVKPAAVMIAAGRPPEGVSPDVANLVGHGGDAVEPLAQFQPAAANCMEVIFSGSQIPQRCNARLAMAP